MNDWTIEQNEHNKFLIDCCWTVAKWPTAHCSIHRSILCRCLFSAYGFLCHVNFEWNNIPILATKSLLSIRCESICMHLIQTHTYSRPVELIGKMWCDVLWDWSGGTKYGRILWKKKNIIRTHSVFIPKFFFHFDIDFYRSWVVTITHQSLNWRKNGREADSAWET